ncbi:AIPR family protein [Serratia fonticola]|uniref:AIPR family protein n=1 Tax=Serratia fonticola TaxID=47917 RepID=UPI0016476E57|nr:AIPR family protein [Serratia fonticola]MBC3252460.1 AIPR family protein [Serratia fonticola]
MSTNDQVLIEQIIQQEHKQTGSYEREDDFFEFYASNQVLKEYDLSYDEIESGLCGATLDGGLDAIYIFINGELVDEDTDLTDKYKKNPTLELVLIQSKNVRSFGEDAILKLSRLSCNLLDLQFKAVDFEKRYSDFVISKFELFRNVYFKVITRKPTLTINYFYVSKGIDVHQNVTNQINDLKRAVSNILTEAEVNFKTVGASELLEIYRKKETEVFNLKLAENPLSSQGKVFISLVSLGNYYDFITDESGRIIKRIFEANVRDYQGKTNVNQEIQDTLKVKDSNEDFWWLNNGVTILASDVSAPGGKSLIIHNPEIVNGLQTSNEIYRYYSTGNNDDDKRAVLIRVIVPDNEESRDRIIRATNSQTPIPKASLRATDAIHRDIEDYLKHRGLYYDRRKNFYRNEGKKPSEIISLAFLAQCVISIALQKPDFARARPSTLLEDNTSYRKLYNKNNSVNAYYVASYIGKKVERFLKEKQSIDVTEKNNLKFYIIYAVAAKTSRNIHPGFKALSEINTGDISDEILEASYKLVLETYLELGGGDQLAKGKSLIERLKNII